MKNMFLIFFIAVILLPEAPSAHEIIFKDGKVIRSRTCWTEGGYVKYEKLGNIVSIAEERVEKIVYDKEGLIAYDAQVVFNNGDSIFVKNLSLENETYTCSHNDRITHFSKKDIKFIENKSSRSTSPISANDQKAFSDYYRQMGPSSGTYSGNRNTDERTQIESYERKFREINEKLYDVEMRSQGWTKTGNHEYRRDVVPHSWQYNQQYGIIEYKKTK
jgi:hypothetical protein